MLIHYVCIGTTKLEEKMMQKMMMAMGIALASMTSLTQAAGYGVIDLERLVENSSYLKQQNTAVQQKIQPQTTKI